MKHDKGRARVYSRVSTDGVLIVMVFWAKAPATKRAMEAMTAFMTGWSWRRVEQSVEGWKTRQPAEKLKLEMPAFYVSAQICLQ